MEKDEGVLVIRRIHVTYHLTAPADAAETVERVHDLHRDRCPVYRSLCDAIQITTHVERTDP